MKIADTAHIKIVVIGNVAVGKTAFCRRYGVNVFEESYKATIGTDFVAKAPYQLWDVAGQERFGAVTKLYYRGAMGVIVVVDWHHFNSVGVARKWIEDFKSKCEKRAPILIVANKSDLPHAFPIEEMDSLVKGDDNIVGWISVSAKKGEGINEAMDLLGKHIDTSYLGEDAIDDEFVEFQDVDGTTTKRGTCCL